MKTILAATDYSDIARNSVIYAAELAAFSGAKLVLAHAYHLPLPVNGVPVITTSPEDLDSENQKRLSNFAKEIQKLNPDKIVIQSVARAGFASDILEQIANEQNPDLIVMGITGSGQLSRTLLGSTTTTVIRKAKTPVLVVPAHAKFKPVKKMVLAYDGVKEVKNSVLKKLKGFVKLFSAHLLVADVLKTTTAPTFENTLAGATLETSLADVPNSFYFPSNNDFEEGIDAFTSAYNGDWLVMLPHDYSFLQTLFHRSQTKQMALHTHIPLLTIHD